MQSGRVIRAQRSGERARYPVDVAHIISRSGKTLACTGLRVMFGGALPARWVPGHGA